MKRGKLQKKKKSDEQRERLETSSESWLSSVERRRVRTDRVRVCLFFFSSRVCALLDEGWMGIRSSASSSLFFASVAHNGKGRGEEEEEDFSIRSGRSWDAIGW